MEQVPPRAPLSPEKLSVKCPPPLVRRLDRLVGVRYADRSEAVRVLLTQALDALDERAARLP
jgi:Arc/MetJ-type ribon-helix-helix transcriptional regulator